MDRQNKRRPENAGSKNAEETAQDGEDWRQYYVVAAMGLKGL